MLSRAKHLVSFSKKVTKVTHIPVISEQLVSRVLSTRISYNFQLITHYIKLTTC
ncbi:hypothetical protein KL86DYS1_31043 [uncultured Dysgonomonas sp.]|uniref:Uncharacterized protein n=1 Tax=uncultured Dysgonomonas sp. TaxID=206096 RepID=A0A212K099_9BACT|nr:hypothetical protein KL86DYS1_31043 [uncultured Dysgonomonas sp.]